MERYTVFVSAVCLIPFSLLLFAIYLKRKIPSDVPILKNCTLFAYTNGYNYINVLSKYDVTNIL